jgi:hypothetical protein
MIANTKTREPVYPLRLTQDDVDALIHRWVDIFHHPRARVLEGIRHARRTGKYAGDFVVPEV